MDRIEFFQKTIINVLKDNADYYKGTTNPLNVFVIEDTKSNHFQLLMQGWDEDDYIFQCLFHLDIIDNQIWIQYNTTDFPIEDELIKLGVKPSEIVLGLKHPKFREILEAA